MSIELNIWERMAEARDVFFDLYGKDPTESEDNYLLLNIIRHLRGQDPIVSLTNARARIGKTYKPRRKKALVE